MVFGTRPEVIKLAPLAWEMGPVAYFVHTGQHPLPTLRPVLADLGLGPPAVRFEVVATPRGRQLADAIRGVADALAETRPDAVVVQGDTTSTLAGALAGVAAGIPVAHVEAGLRAFDRKLPEELNRIAVDHLADLLLAPTATAAGHLAAEGIPPTRVVVTGNTVVDAARRLLPTRDECAAIATASGVEPGHFVLSTFHRVENVDDPDALRRIVTTLAGLPLPVVLPVHPRTADRAARAGIELATGALRPVAPLGVRDFLALEATCALMVSDSGGVQEEASIVGRPVVVVRHSTERPETLGTSSVLAPIDRVPTVVAGLLEAVPGVHADLAAHPNPFGDGAAAGRIVRALRDLVGEAPAAAVGTMGAE
jgi:UDP-N-acetylglucosamine 2-epimerase (non-hydrolysing)